MSSKKNLGGTDIISRDIRLLLQKGLAKKNLWSNSFFLLSASGLSACFSGGDLTEGNFTPVPIVAGAQRGEVHVGDARNGYAVSVDPDTKEKLTVTLSDDGSAVLISGGHFQDDKLMGIQSLSGGAGDDTFTGNVNNNMLAGGDGNDKLNGGDGNDLLVGGAGDDTLTGGSGSDTASYSDSVSAVTATLAADNSGSNSGGNSGQQPSPAVGRSFSASSYDSQGNLLISSGQHFTHIGGTDEGHTAGSAFGLSVGTDTLDGIENLVGGLGGDIFAGNEVANILMGGEGNDKLSGLDGDDTLYGGAGDDKLTGGEGSDKFMASSGTDRITDFAFGDKLLFEGFSHLRDRDEQIEFSGVGGVLNLSFDSDGDGSFDSIIIFENLSDTAEDRFLVLSSLDIVGVDDAPIFFPDSVVNVSADEYTGDPDSNRKDDIFTIRAVDPEGGTLVYLYNGVDIINIADMRGIEIDSNTGVFSAYSGLDYEPYADQNGVIAFDLVTWHADGSSLHQVTHSMTLTINDINESPEFVDLEVFNGRIFRHLFRDEDAPYTFASRIDDIYENGFYFTNPPEAIDPEGDDLVYTVRTLDSSLQDAFSIDDRGRVGFTGLDFEDLRDNYQFDSVLQAEFDEFFRDRSSEFFPIEVEVTASDGEFSVSRNLVYLVRDVNELPELSAASTSMAVDENFSGALFTIAVTDPEGDSLTYSISGLSPSLAGAFSFDDSGVVSLDGSIDYDSLRGDKTLAFKVVIGDGAEYNADFYRRPADVTHLVTLTINDVNESPEVLVDIPVYSIAEVATTDADLFTLRAHVRDPESADLTYSLNGLPDSVKDGYFSIDSRFSTVRLNKALDYESLSSVGQLANGDRQIVFAGVVSDGVNSVEVPLTVNVSNVEEFIKFPDDLQTEITVTENVGGVVLELNGYDPDGTRDVVYAKATLADTRVTPARSIKDDTVIPDDARYHESGAFYVGPYAEVESVHRLVRATGVYSFDGDGLDYEALTSDVYTLEITLFHDSGRYPDAIHQVTHTLTVTVEDVDEAPEVSASLSTSVAENVAGVIFMVDAADPEGASLTYSLSGVDSTLTSLLSIDESSGAVSLSTAFDYENLGSVSESNEFLVLVRDASFTSTQSVTLTIENANEAFTLSTGSVSIDVDQRVIGIIHTVTASDPDMGEFADLTYELKHLDSTVGDSFSVDENGVVSVVNGIKFSTLTATSEGIEGTETSQYEYSFGVEVSDGLNVDTQTITLRLMDTSYVSSVVEGENFNDADIAAHNYRVRAHAAESAALTVDLSANADEFGVAIDVVGSGGSFEGDIFTNIRNLIGGSGDDVFTGGSENNIFEGLEGNDTLTGGDGDDRLDGGAGDDDLRGDAENTYAGKDVFIASAGSDTFLDFSNLADRLSFANFAHITDRDSAKFQFSVYDFGDLDDGMLLVAFDDGAGGVHEIKFFNITTNLDDTRSSDSDTNRSQLEIYFDDRVADAIDYI